MINFLPDNPTIEIVAVSFLGLVFGSFATAIVYRTRHNQSWIWRRNSQNKARSFCPSCNHRLGIKDLIPVFSWFFQWGRCRYCHVKIPREYVFIEITTLIIFWGVYAILDFNNNALYLMVLTPFFVSQLILGIKYKKASKSLFLILILGLGGILLL